MIRTLVNIGLGFTGILLALIAAVALAPSDYERPLAGITAAISLFYFIFCIIGGIFYYDQRGKFDRADNVKKRLTTLAAENPAFHLAEITLQLTAAAAALHEWRNGGDAEKARPFFTPSYFAVLEPQITASLHLPTEVWFDRIRRFREATPVKILEGADHTSLWMRVFAATEIWVRRPKRDAPSSYECLKSPLFGNWEPDPIFGHMDEGFWLASFQDGRWRVAAIQTGTAVPEDVLETQHDE